MLIPDYFVMTYEHAAKKLMFDFEKENMKFQLPIKQLTLALVLLLEKDKNQFISQYI